MHNALKRQGIMMPALSPFMTEGTVTRWKKVEGEAFQAGEVILQIASPQLSSQHTMLTLAPGE